MDDIVRDVIIALEGKCYVHPRDQSRCGSLCPQKLRDTKKDLIGVWRCNLTDGHDGPHHAHDQNRAGMEHCTFVWEDD
jgi:hypothetical protein